MKLSVLESYLFSVILLVLVSITLFLLLSRYLLFSSILLRSIALLIFILVLSPILLLAFILSRRDFPILELAILLRFILLWANLLTLVALKDFDLSRLLLFMRLLLLTSLWNYRVYMIFFLYYLKEILPLSRLAWMGTISWICSTDFYPLLTKV